MKAVFEFNLPKEQADFDVVSRAQDWYELIRDFDDWLRNKIHYATTDTVSIDAEGDIGEVSEIEIGTDELAAIRYNLHRNMEDMHLRFK